MESLRLDLGEELQRELEHAPLQVKARIDERQKMLLEQVYRYRNQKQDELEAYVREQLAETDTDTVSELGQSYSEPKLKSIVKRRPSSSDKRVSFINSPTQVAISKSEGSTDTEATDDELVSPDDPADTPVAVDPEDPAEQAKRSMKPPRPYELSMPALDLRYLTKERRNTQFLDDGTPVPPHSHQDLPQPLDHEDLFNFENESREQPDVESSADEMAQNHHAPLTESSPPRALHAPVTKPKDQFPVGSAPISIQISSSAQGLDGDGGPLPVSEQEREEEKSLTQEGLSVPRNRINELDPCSMSFSQRMEWETLRKRNGH